MLADVRKALIQRIGQSAEICRRGAAVAQTKCLLDERKGYVEFPPEVDIREGDEVVFKASGKTLTAGEVEKNVFMDVVANLRVRSPNWRGRNRGNTVIHNSGVLAGSLSHAAIQQHSPEATQTVTVPAGETRQVTESLRLLLEVLDELGRTEEDAGEVRADAKTAQAQIESPKPKAGVVRSLLMGIKDKLISLGGTSSRPGRSRRSSRSSVHRVAAG